MIARVTQLELERGAVVEGARLPEALRVVALEEVGERLRIEWPGLRTGQHPHLLLDRDQFAQITVVSAEEAHDGDSLRVRLGIEAQRLALAYFEKSVPERREPLKATGYDARDALLVSLAASRSLETGKPEIV